MANAERRRTRPSRDVRKAPFPKISRKGKRVDCRNVESGWWGGQAKEGSKRSAPESESGLISVGRTQRGDAWVWKEKNKEVGVD